MTIQAQLNKAALNKVSDLVSEYPDNKGSLIQFMGNYKKAFDNLTESEIVEFKNEFRAKMTYLAEQA